MKKILFILFLTGFASFSMAQNYELVWSDEFDGNTLDSSIWNIEQRIGVWNTGSNAELQHYRKENVSVGDDGVGNNCLILSAREESYNGYGYTSGRVNTKGKFSFRFGKLEARIKIPDLANGLWPAFWTLGYVNQGWPSCGEIDILEMGHSAGITSGTQNKYIGAACHWENADNYAGYGLNATASENLNEDYHLFTLIWDETKVATYLDDATTPFFVMNVTGSDLEEYRDYTNYILFNLAVGGSLTGVLNAEDVTAPFPANMYIDYVRLYQEVETGDLVDSSEVIFGSFGVYEEEANVAMNTDIGFDTEIISSNLTEVTDDSPKEGSSALAYQVSASTEFELRVNSIVNRNMQNYANGSIQFWFKTTLTDSFSFGISDWEGEESFFTLKEGVAQNPPRNGEWQLAYIQLAAIADRVDLTKIKDLFIVKSNCQSTGSISIDRIIWSETAYQTNDNNYYGIFAEHTEITTTLDFGGGGVIYIWNGFSENASEYAFFGEDVLPYLANQGTWNGFGIHSDPALDLSAFFGGNMHFHYKTTSSADIEIGFKNSADDGWKKIIPASEVENDGEWHAQSIALKDFTPAGSALTANDLIDIAIPFYMVGTLDISFDEIYFSKNGTALSYPASGSIFNKENLKFESVYIYPNPVKNEFSVSGLESEATITLFDQTGRLIETKHIRPDESVNLANYNTGIYYLRIRSNDLFHNYKLVKE
ncbi:MAG: family 16 glycosylhydrolase [Bacteroidales bacterium]|nr:family 16 glycosylhydrolase [Bacteroidales bacterium]MBN2818086.1 family 16 glycosylhydrolase [Bacteroidales bacterium]